MEDTAVEDAMMIAKAFREATEIDTMDFLNTQSRNSSEGEGSTVMICNQVSGRIEPMQYYLVSAPWLRQAWRSVLKPPNNISKNWLENVGEIDNAFLVVSSPNDAAQQSAGGILSFQQRANFDFRKDLQHVKDFYLVGNNAWLLLSKKFGTSHTFPAVVRHHKSRESNFAVDIYDQTTKRMSSNGNGELIPIPASGRFPYELEIDFLENPQEDATKPVSRNGRPLVIVMPLPDEVGTEFGQRVSDDSEADCADPLSPFMLKDGGSDGVPQDEEMSMGEEKAPGGVLLLPPSTTSSSALYSPIGKARAPSSPTGTDDFGLFGSSTSNGCGSEDYWAMDSDNIGTIPKKAHVTTVSRYRYGSGLANLGNTCFMNTTLQCLSHTRPLQKYFLSGDYRNDLNKANPLGTGGELATAFATLLTDMWTQETTTTVTNLFPEPTSRIVWSESTAHVVYPRDFKYTVGKHAEQFMGYDQHDSQEFATYLLDALHEDTNRVTKKPYIEKPEQAEGETDEEAAEKAWGLHLQRENSKVLENFMGQIKSRVQCSESGCGRVSTTFDPFMYLSVPIPGSSERTLTVHYFPVNPAKRVQKISVTVPKSATMQELAKCAREQVLKLGVEDELSIEDVVATDVWQKDLYSWYLPTDDVERIRDTDETYLFGLRPTAEIRASLKKGSEDSSDELEMYNIKELRQKRFSLDLPTMTRLNAGDNWTNEFAKYLRNHLGFLNAFNPTKGTTDDRVKLFMRATKFLELCFQETGNMDTTNATVVNDELIPGLVERCDASPVFENVKSLHDLAILEFCTAKMRAEILRLIKARNTESSGGVKIAIRQKAPGVVPSVRSQNVCGPLVLRIPSNMTVYGLREELAKRLARSIRKPGEINNSKVSSGQATSESAAVGSRPETNGFDDKIFGSPELLILRQIPLTYEKKNPTYTVNKSYDSSTQLGSLETGRGGREGRAPPMASSRDPEESHIVAHIVGDEGTVNLEWPRELIDRVFDVDEFDAIDDPGAVAEDENDAPLTHAREAAKNSKTTVLDCIEKYCQMEQLEETEMWYCSKCKKHVRAWKQFHLYRAPPILMIHLKRFQYSAITHRRDKIGLLIDFPLEGLDLTEQVMHWTDGEKPIYDCYGVSNHYGGLGGGHYTAHVLNDDGTWCYYDDSRITVGAEPEKIVSEAAYVLYYRRRDGDHDSDFLIRLQTPDSFGPAIITDLPNCKAFSTSSEVSGSNAAVVDDDNMEIEDNGSQNTSVMGSMDGTDDQQASFHDADEQLPDEEQPPRQ